MRLTAELIKASPQFWNPLKVRELNLRGHRIPSIENLAATLDQFRLIDLTDNSLRSLEGFPTLKNLEMLFLTNNRITTISPTLSDKLPNLTTIILTGNQIATVESLIPLTTLSQLSEVSLLNNPVVSQPDYRLCVIAMLPRVKILDFVKVTTKERIAAREIQSEGKTFIAGEAVQI
ncbi:hypothetical protein P9112_002847 [Eukaryota sp. TZLM1-RC]